MRSFVVSVLDGLDAFCEFAGLLLKGAIMLAFSLGLIFALLWGIFALIAWGSK